MKRTFGIIGCVIAFASVPFFANAQSSNCVSITQKLQKGSRGAQVTSVQTRLATIPAIYPGGTVSGYFGSLTEKAVQQFQIERNIVTGGTPATTGFGVTGPRTRTALNAISCGEIATVGWFTVQPDESTSRVVRFSAQVKVKEGAHTYTVEIGEAKANLSAASSVCEQGSCSHILSGAIEQVAQGSYTALLKVDGVIRAERSVVLSGSVLDRVAEITVTAPVASTKIPYGAGLDIAWYALKAPYDSKTQISLESETGAKIGAVGNYNGASGQFMFTLPDKKADGCKGSALECLAHFADECIGTFCDLKPGNYRIRVELFSGSRSLGSATSPLFELLNSQGLPSGFGNGGSFLDPNINLNPLQVGTSSFYQEPLTGTGAQCMYSGVPYADGITLDVTCGDYYQQSCGSTAGQTVTCRNGSWMTANGSSTVLQGVTGSPGDSINSCRTQWGGQTVPDGSQIPYQPFFTNGVTILSFNIPMMQCTAGSWQKCNWDGTGCAAWNPVQL